jgi:hypothetical protein
MLILITGLKNTMYQSRIDDGPVNTTSARVIRNYQKAAAGLLSLLVFMSPPVYGANVDKRRGGPGNEEVEKRKKEKDTRRSKGPAWKSQTRNPREEKFDGDDALSSSARRRVGSMGAQQCVALVLFVLTLCFGPSLAVEEGRYEWGNNGNRGNRTMSPSEKDRVPRRGPHYYGVWYTCNGKCKRVGYDCVKGESVFTLLGNGYLVLCDTNEYVCADEKMKECEASRARIP